MHSARPGNVSVYFLLFMGLTIPTMFWTINIWRIAEGKVSQHRVTDAAAHAALAKLTEEFFDSNDSKYYSYLFYGDPGEIELLCQTHANQEAINYAGDPTPSTLFSNYVDGAKLDFEINNDNDNDDVQYGYYDLGSATPTFVPIDPSTTSTHTVDERRTINAVRVKGIRSVDRGNSVPLFGPSWTGYTDAQIETYTTAVLDRRVVGFRIHASALGGGAKLAYQTIPLAPAAILNDSMVSNSWYNKVEKPDIDTPTTSARRNYGTIQINIPLAAAYTPAMGPDNQQNAKLINIGSLADYTELADQVTGGVTADDEADYITNRGHGLILDESTYTLPVSPMAASPAMDLATDISTLSQAFQTLADDGTERAWPLADTLPVSVDITVTGFVAARILTVEVVQDGAATDYIRLTLQPTLLETPTAYTDYSGRFLKTTTPANPYESPGYSRLINPYLGRVRLVE